MGRNDSGRSGCSIGVTFGKIALLLAVQTGVCVAQNESRGAESVKYDAILDYPFQQRQGPVQVTRDDAKTLGSKGYFELGTIAGFYRKTEDAHGTVEGMLKEAAKRGGDVLRIETENVPGNIPSGKYKKECAEQENAPATGSTGGTTTYSSSCYTDIHGFQHCNTTPSTAPGHPTGGGFHCTKWEEVPVDPISGLTTTGTVWRHLEKAEEQDLKYGLLNIGLPKAAEMGNANLVKLQLQWGADVNATDEEGYTALIRAIQGHRPDVVKLLLDNGADVNAPNIRTEKNYWTFKEGTPLTDAIDPAPFKDSKPFDEEMVKLLVTRAAKFEQKESVLDSLATSAPGTECGKKIRLLVSLGANVNWQDGGGETPLMTAALVANLEAVKTLLALGADKNLRDKGGRTAADQAIDGAKRLHGKKWGKKMTDDEKEVMRLLSQ